MTWAILARSLGQLLFGFVIACVITGIVLLVRDYRRSHRPLCCWGCSAMHAHPDCPLHRRARNET